MLSGRNKQQLGRDSRRLRHYLREADANFMLQLYRSRLRIEAWREENMQWLEWVTLPKGLSSLFNSLSHLYDFLTATPHSLTLPSPTPPAPPTLTITLRILSQERVLQFQMEERMVGGQERELRELGEVEAGVGQLKAEQRRLRMRMDEAIHRTNAQNEEMQRQMAAIRKQMGEMEQTLRERQAEIERLLPKTDPNVLQID